MVDYCTLQEIKWKLKEHVTDEVLEDTELRSIRTGIQAYIDKKLKTSGITTPLTATNDSITDICAELSAGEYRRRRGTPDEENSSWKFGSEKLDTYIDAEGDEEIPFIVGEATS